MKKVLFLLALLLALGGAYLVLTHSHSDGGRDEQPTAQAINVLARVSAPIRTAATLPPTATAQATATPTACIIRTGVTAGTVNLRRCAGLACEVLTILGEGEPLTVITPANLAEVTAGEWLQVRTGNGLTGYLNSKFCK